MLHRRGFTLVEIMVVLVIIGILATIVYLAYGQYRFQSGIARGKSDIQVLEGAIKTARQNLGGVILSDITKNTWTARGCSANQSTGGQNVEKLEPRLLPKTHKCWTTYNLTIDRIQSASGINLSNFKKGDAFGNPYIIDENEGEFPTRPCERDFLSMVKPGQYVYYTKVAHVGEDDSFNNNDPYNVSLYIGLIKPSSSNCQ